MWKALLRLPLNMDKYRSSKLTRGQDNTRKGTILEMNARWKQVVILPLAAMILLGLPGCWDAKNIQT